MTEPERASEVLDRLLTAPTAALRERRTEIVEIARWHDGIEERSLLAEHYRALGAPDQAARWGILRDGWVRASELRALRLVLLERYPSWDARDYLGLAHDQPVPASIADVAPLSPPARKSWHGVVDLAIGLAVVAGLIGAIGYVVLLFRVVGGVVADGLPVWEALRAVQGKTLVLGVCMIAGFSVPVVVELVDTRVRAARMASRVTALLATLKSDNERHALARGWLDSVWEARSQRAARASRRHRPPAPSSCRGRSLGRCCRRSDDRRGAGSIRQNTG